MIRNNQTQFGTLSKTLHWISAILMPALVIIGTYMAGLSNEDAWYWRLLDLHSALGLCVFVLVSIKAGWMLISPNPQPVTTLQPWERITARLVHALLIVAMLVLPVTGYLTLTAEGDPIAIYGLFEIPSLLELKQNPAELVITLHMVMAYSVAVLMTIHILAALKHHFIDQDDVLRRMTVMTELER